MTDGSVFGDEVEDAAGISEVTAGRGEEGNDSTTSSTFHPNTPIAPTVDFAVKVVVAVAHDRLAVPELMRTSKSFQEAHLTSNFPPLAPQHLLPGNSPFSQPSANFILFLG
jgi:hypothetical protein